MQLPIKTLTTLTVSALAALTMAIALAPAAEAREQRGCPTNAFCIYPQNAYWNNNHPSFIMRPDYGRFDDHEWWNLSNQFGIHKVFNNATPGGGFWQYVTLNSGYNGGGPGLGGRGIAAGKSYDLNLTPVNSVTVWWAQLTNNW
jgi:hypothetical protein